MKEPNFIKIVAIDGLDGIGKSTFIETLYHYMASSVNKLELRVISYHLPDYENEYGKQIRAIFNRKNTNITSKQIDELAELNNYNKSKWWADHFDLWQETGNILLVMDRYVLSNYLYSAPYFPDMEKWIDNQEMEEKYRFRIPQPDMQIVLYCDPELQRRRLSRRRNLEIYEASSNQNRLLKAFGGVIKKRYGNASSSVEFYPTHYMDARYNNAHNADDPIRLSNGMKKYMMHDIITKINSQVLKGTPYKIFVPKCQKEPDCKTILENDEREFKKSIGILD